MKAMAGGGKWVEVRVRGEAKAAVTTVVSRQGRVRGVEEEHGDSGGGGDGRAVRAHGGRRGSATARAPVARSARAPCARAPPRWSEAASTAPLEPHPMRASRARRGHRPAPPRPSCSGAAPAASSGHDDRSRSTRLKARWCSASRGAPPSWPSAEAPNRRSTHRRSCACALAEAPEPSPGHALSWCWHAPMRPTGPKTPGRREALHTGPPRDAKAPGKQRGHAVHAGGWKLEMKRVTTPDRAAPPNRPPGLRTHADRRARRPRSRLAERGFWLCGPLGLVPRRAGRARRHARCRLAQQSFP